MRRFVLLLLSFLVVSSMTIAGTHVAANEDSQSALLCRMSSTPVQDFWKIVANPNIVFLLICLAIIGVLIEVWRPGLVFPGLIGVIAGYIVFRVLGILNVNFAGLVLIIVAFILFLAEILTPGFGLLAACGAAALIAGSLMLFREGAMSQISPWLVVTVSLLIAAFIAYAASRAVVAHRRQPATGMEELIGKIGEVRVALNPAGQILISGELWQAEAESGAPIQPGEEVVVTRNEGLKLWVKRK